MDGLDARVRGRLRQLRGERGPTLQQVADAANLDVSTLGRLESGARRLAVDHLPGPAGALGVTVDEEFVDEPGEAVEFSTRLPHWFGAVDGPVELVAILGGAGQRAHLDAHARPA